MWSLSILLSAESPKEKATLFLDGLPRKRSAPLRRRGVIHLLFLVAAHVEGAPLGASSPACLSA